MAVYPEIDQSRLKLLCGILSEAVTHREIAPLLKDARIEEVLCDGSKAERFFLTLAQKQSLTRTSNAILNLVTKVFHPSRFQDKSDSYLELRQKLNFHLAFLGLEIGQDGQLRPVSQAKTLSEAETRAAEIQSELHRRQVHPDVLSFCRPELVDQNYFHCVLEASKSLAQKIRNKTGLTADGAELVDRAFSTKDPWLALNSLQTNDERMEQSGFANLLKGIFGTFRNVTAHRPKIYWAIDKKEAMDALTIISYAHRRLDEVVPVPKKVEA
jgi:uncharacterized protein (TIGR02391 family)